ncbi:hypothetical protein CIX30_28350 [Salmonella enterica]|nr:hypothetical protein [Salmonella enterica]EBN6863591.1 hypothetical protein [Salmonella enterica]EBQ9005058.1 hypothetical protein [Salmonella enterica subsp. enterica serovar Blockley]ECS7528328.1 hypothetical protein [Salmonella enterica]ECU7995293.1 hypothetical protein [Salmonella enterica subsp. enterica serovar Toucra]
MEQEVIYRTCSIPQQGLHRVRTADRRDVVTGMAEGILVHQQQMPARLTGIVFLFLHPAQHGWRYRSAAQPATDGHFPYLLINNIVKMQLRDRQRQQKRRQTRILVGGLLKDFTKGSRTLSVSVNGR